MGTNYYLVNKKDYDLNEKLFKNLNAINTEKLYDEIKKLLEKQYSSVLDILDINKRDDLKYHFENSFNEIISAIDLQLTYDLKFHLSLIEFNSKHIGKSSWGWLFNFQEQDEWHSYKEFKNFILNEENRKNQIIIDEENRKIEPEELLEIIDNKQCNPRNLENPDNFRYCKNVDGYRFSQGDFS